MSVETTRSRAIPLNSRLIAGCCILKSYTKVRFYTLKC